jgi:hypothetical protein
VESRAVIEMVVKMREAQRRYFRTRSRADQDASKALEKKVDDALREYLNGPSLFDRE